MSSSHNLLIHLVPTNAILIHIEWYLYSFGRVKIWLPLRFSREFENCTTSLQNSSGRKLKKLFSSVSTEVLLKRLPTGPHGLNCLLLKGSSQSTCSHVNLHGPFLESIDSSTMGSSSSSSPVEAWWSSAAFSNSSWKATSSSLKHSYSSSLSESNRMNCWKLYGWRGVFLLLFISGCLQINLLTKNLKFPYNVNFHHTSGEYRYTFNI